MHMLLYTLAVFTAIAGACLGIMKGALDPIANGLLAAVIFGVLGKLIHLLERLDHHMGALREERRSSPTRLALVPEEYFVQEGGTMRSEKNVAAPGSRFRPH